VVTQKSSERGARPFEERARAPFGLLRYPGLLAAVIIGALLLTLVAAAYPMFLSRSEGALLRAKIADPIITP